MDIFLEGFEIAGKMPISDWKNAKVPKKFFKVFFKNVKAFRCKRQGVLGETPWRLYLMCYFSSLRFTYLHFIRKFRQAYNEGKGGVKKFLEMYTDPPLHSG